MIEEKIEYRDEEHGIEILAFPDDKFSLDVKIDYNSKVLGFQYANLDDIKQFPEEISSARTFVFLHELEFLLQRLIIRRVTISKSKGYQDISVILLDMVWALIFMKGHAFLLTVQTL